MKKRVLSLVVSLAMVLTTMTPVYADAGQPETSTGSVVGTVDTSVPINDASTDLQTDSTGGTEQVSDIPASDQTETPGVSETSEGSAASGIPEGSEEGGTDTGTGLTDTSQISGTVEEAVPADNPSGTTEVSATSEASEVPGPAEVPAAGEGNTEEAKPAADLGLNGSQVRLFVGTSDPSILDQDHILSGYNGLYILAYGSAQEAAIAYSRLAGYVSFIAYDKAVIEVADIDDVSGQVQTGDTNAVAELSTTPTVAGNGMIALIDTGASGSNVVSAVSMLGDDPSDDNGHGSRMAALIDQGFRLIGPCVTFHALYGDEVRDRRERVGDQPFGIGLCNS